MSDTTQYVLRTLNEILCSSDIFAMWERVREIVVLQSGTFTE